MENGITNQQDKRGWRSRGGRGMRDTGPRHGADRMGPDHYDSEGSVSDDAMDMDIDHHVVNPNEF